MRSLKFFLEIRIIQKLNSIYLVQDAYIDKLVRNYQIQTNLNYKQNVKSICYSVIIIRSNIIKIAFKLTKHLINLDLDHLTIVNHRIRYLYEAKHLEIKFDVLKNEKLTNNVKNKLVFETSVDTSFANKKDRRSIKNYTFKLFNDLID